MRNPRVMVTPQRVPSTAHTHHAPRINAHTRTHTAGHCLPDSATRCHSIDTRAPYGATQTPSPYRATPYQQPHDRRVMRVAGLVRVGGSIWASVLLSHCSYRCHIEVFVTLCGVYHCLSRKLVCDTYMKGEGVREGAKRPTAPPSLDFNYNLIIDDCFWRQLDLPPWLF